MYHELLVHNRSYCFYRLYTRLASNSFDLTYERKRCLWVTRWVELTRQVCCSNCKTQNLTSCARHKEFWWGLSSFTFNIFPFLDSPLQLYTYFIYATTFTPLYINVITLTKSSSHTHNTLNKHSGQKVSYTYIFVVCFHASFLPSSTMIQDCDQDSSKKRKRDGPLQQEDFLYNPHDNHSKRLLLDTELHLDTPMPLEWQRCLDIKVIKTYNSPQTPIIFIF